MAREMKAADMSNPQALIYYVRSLRIVRLEALRIGGELARGVKAADMSNFQAVI